MRFFRMTVLKGVQDSILQSVLSKKAQNWRHKLEITQFCTWCFGGKYDFLLPYNTPKHFLVFPKAFWRKNKKLKFFEILDQKNLFTIFGNFSKNIFWEKWNFEKKIFEKFFFEKFQKKFQKFFKKCQEYLCGPPDKILGSIVRGGKRPFFPPCSFQMVNSRDSYLTRLKIILLST